MNVAEYGWARAVRSYGSLPLLFARNEGQFDENTRFAAQEGRFRCALEADRMVMTFFESRSKREDEEIVEGFVLALRFEGRGGTGEPEGVWRDPGKYNYLRGGDSSRHIQGVDLYRSVAYRELWPGIDMAVQGRGGKLKFDWLLRPGAHAEDIRFAYEGSGGARIDEAGDLLLDTPFGQIADRAPVAYQEAEGRRLEIGCRYRTEPRPEGGAWIGFELTEPYDGSLPLVIDPVIEYSTYLGGSGTEEGNAIAVDGAGFAYVTGSTVSADFPVTPGAFQTMLRGAEDFFVTKLNPTGTGLVYSTYIGGSARDIGQAIAVDAGGHAYVTGSCFSGDYPTTPGAFQPVVASARAHAVVTKLSPDGGSLVYSTYLGGTGGDSGYGIAVDAAGEAYVVGQTDSPDFPVTPGALITTNPSSIPIAFVTKLNAAGSALVYSTYLGGRGTTDALGIAVDAAGNAFIGGQTVAPDFPTTPGAFQTTLQGDIDGFVAKLNPTGTALVYSTILGSPGNDDINGIAIDDAGNAYVTGQSTSPDFPLTPGAFVTPLGIRRVFVTKLNPAGTGLIYSALIGGHGSNTPFGITLNAAREAIVTGQTTSNDYPVTPDAFQPFLNGEADAFVTVLDPFGSSLSYSTYLGGSATDLGNGVAVDPAGDIYVTGQTFSYDFPTTPGAFQPVRRGIDAFVTKFGSRAMLKLNKFTDRFEVRPGEHVRYFIELLNEGVPLTNVIVEDPQLGFFTVLPELFPFEIQVFVVDFVVPPDHPPGIIVNEVFARADQLRDPVSAIAHIRVVETPRLFAAKTVSPPAAIPGQTVTFTITLRNGGNTELINVRIFDPFLGFDQFIGNLAQGTSFQIDWPFTIPQGQEIGLTIANVAEITADNLPDPERVGTAVEVLPAPRLGLAKSADRIAVLPGESILFTLEVENTGNVVLTNVVIADDTIGMDFRVPSLAIGETRSFEVPFLVPLETPPQTYTNTATATSDQTPSTTASFDVRVIAAPLLGVRKLPSVTSAAPRHTLQYTIIIDNIGNVPLTDVRLDDPLLGFSRTVPRLAVGERLEFAVPYTIPRSAPVGSDIVNQLTATAVETGAQQVSAIVAVAAVGLTVAKVADRTTAAPGDTIVYTLTVTNALAAAQTGIALSDPLLGILETLPTLAPGATVTRTGSYVVPAGAPNGSVIDNEWTASSDQTPPQTAAAAVVVISVPDAPTTLAVTKRPDRNVAAPGETIRYAVAVTNTGANPATGVSVADSLTGAVVAIAVIAPGATTEVELAYTVSAAAVQGTEIANRVTVNWLENQSGSPATSEARVVVALPSTLLSIEVEATPDVARPGETVIKTIRIVNVSDRTLTDVPNRTLTHVRVIDNLLGFSTVMPALGPGESRILTLPFKIPANAVGGQIFRNDVNVFSDQSPLQQASVDIVAASLPDVLLTETVDRAEGRPGDIVHFTITLRNTGNVDLLNGVLTARLLDLFVRIERFDIGAEEIIRVPFRLPDVEDDTVIASPVTFSADNGPKRTATASVRVIAEEEE
ncbi:DUF7948 domain-containing protein [Cohnella sp. 56]|uniref:DUF7948 domain-containing protein n=1 Tax=Cohnella sp. 56 TaxID=3113722 RepID=UPI0030E9AA18